MKKTLLAVVALTIAASAAFAANAAPASTVPIAEERAASMPLAALQAAKAVEVAPVSIVSDGGKLDALVAEVSASVLPSSPARVAAIAVSMRSREAVAYHLLL